MKITSVRAALAAVLVLAAAGCGDDAGKRAASTAATAAGTTHAPPESLTALLPPDVVAVAWAPSLKALEDQIAGMMVATTGRSDAGPGLAQAAGPLLGLAPDDLDLAGGALVAVTLAEGAPTPSATAIVPVRNADAVIAKVKAHHGGAADVVAAGSHLIVAPEGGYRRGAGLPTRFAGGFPKYDLAIKVDVAALWRRYGADFAPATDALLAALPEIAQPDGTPVDLAGVARPFLDAAASVLSAAGVWDFGFRLHPTLELELVHRSDDPARDPTAALYMPRDQSALARTLPDLGAMRMVASFDASAMTNLQPALMKALLGAVPESRRSTVAASFETMKKSIELIGPGMAMTGGFSKSGLEMVSQMECSDPERYVGLAAESYVAMSKDAASGMTPLPPRDVDGRRVTSVRVTTRFPAVDAGAGGAPKSLEMTTHLVPGKGRVLMVIGDDALLRRAFVAETAGATAEPAASWRAAGADVALFAEVDFHALMAGVQEFLGAASGAGAELPFTTPARPEDRAKFRFTVNATPESRRIRLSMDIAKLIKSMKGR
ncbi:MAG TPA: hypothetical protein VEI02_00255 [Planctomycetota bacterium]|nr:hypothetical protein [Planctomycetota bacterium]